MLAVVRDRAIHHPADQFHVALLFRFDRPCHERQQILRATLNCAGLRQASTAALPVYGARGRSIRDATLGPSKDRRVPAHSSRQPGKVPEPGKGTNRTEGRERDRTRVLDHESLAQLVSAQVSDLPLGGSGMTCPRCQQDNPSHANFCLACGIPLRRTSESGPPGVPYAELRRALTEGTEQQRATAYDLSQVRRTAFGRTSRMGSWCSAVRPSTSASCRRATESHSPTSSKTMGAMGSWSCDPPPPASLEIQSAVIDAMA